MNDPIVTRRNNLNSSLQDGHSSASFPLAAGALALHAQIEEHRAVTNRIQEVNQEIAFREAQLRRFEEAFEATIEARAAKQARHSHRFGQAVAETVEAESSAEVEAAEQLNARRTEESRARAEAADREKAAALLARDEARKERRRQREAAAAYDASLSTFTVPVMDMRFCISNLEAIRLEARDFTLKDFSDYCAPDNKKTTPNRPNTFVPNRLARDDNPLWAPFYDSS